MQSLQPSPQRKPDGDLGRVFENRALPKIERGHPAPIPLATAAAKRRELRPDAVDLARSLPLRRISSYVTNGQGAFLLLRTNRADAPVPSGEDRFGQSSEVIIALHSRRIGRNKAVVFLSGFLGFFLCAAVVSNAAASDREVLVTDAPLAPQPPSPPSTAPVAPSDPTPPATEPLPPEAHQRVAANVPSLLSVVGAPDKQQWEAEHGGFTLSRFALARRLSDRPVNLLSNPDTLPRTRAEFLQRVAHDTWHGISAYTDKENGLILDNIHLSGGALPPISLRVGDYTNITNIGLHLAAIVAARQLGLISETDAQGTTAKIVTTLASLKTHEGYFFNYYDTTTTEPTSSFISFVDTSWLVAGLMISRQAFPALAPRISEILTPINFHFFYNEHSGLMSHGYYANLGTRSVYEYGLLYTESRLGSLIAIGKGDVPASHWQAMRRTAPSLCTGIDCPELIRTPVAEAGGRKRSASYYRWRSTRYVPSWGGSMFEAFMPRLLLDEQRWAPQSLGSNGNAHAELQRLYATDVLGYPVWGMSPCVSSATGLYGEYGVAGLGVRGYSETIVTPHAAALALDVTPEEATDSLMQMARRYPIYSPFGFYDAVDPSTGKVAYDQLALDQLMLFLSVANHLNGGNVRERFAADPWIAPVLPMLAQERFFN